MRWHQPTIGYVARRTAEGLTEKDIIRCWKRFVARDIYRVLIQARQMSAAAA
jgi:transposase